jgi:hypothetical protein
MAEFAEYDNIIETDPVSWYYIYILRSTITA